MDQDESSDNSNYHVMPDNKSADLVVMSLFFAALLMGIVAVGFFRGEAISSAANNNNTFNASDGHTVTSHDDERNTTGKMEEGLSQDDFALDDDSVLDRDVVVLTGFEEIQL